METVDFKLSKAERSCLDALASNSSELKDLLQLGFVGPHDSFVLRLNREEAEFIRELVFDFMVSQGFDGDYELTAEGQILDDLAYKLAFPRGAGSVV